MFTLTSAHLSEPHDCFKSLIEISECHLMFDTPAQHSIRASTVSWSHIFVIKMTLVSSHSSQRCLVHSLEVLRGSHQHRSLSFKDFYVTVSGEQQFLVKASPDNTEEMLSVTKHNFQAIRGVCGSSHHKAKSKTPPPPHHVSTKLATSAIQILEVAHNIHPSLDPG